MKISVALILFSFLIPFHSSAQFNLKKKLNKKADQMAEEFLFGKKKNKDKEETSSNPIPTDTSYEDINSSNQEDNENTSLEDYMDKEVNWSDVPPSSVVHFSVLLAALPNSGAGYRLAEKPEGSTMQMGESTYSTASKELGDNDTGVSLSLIDYKDVSSLYSANTQNFSYESTEGKSESITVGEFQGWYMEDYENGSINLMLFIKDRYVYNASGEGVSKDDLIAITSKAKLNKLP